MDPGPVIETTSNLGSPTFTAILFMLSLGLMEIIKVLLNWVAKRGKPTHQQTLLVQLDPEVSNIIHDTGNKVENVRAIVSRVDADGTPLVYADRKVERSIDKIAEVLKDIGESQRKLADMMQKLNDRFDEHDRRDSVVFARLADSQSRIEDVAAISHDNVIEFKRDHQQTLEKLDKLLDKVGSGQK